MYVLQRQHDAGQRRGHQHRVHHHGGPRAAGNTLTITGALNNSGSLTINASGDLVKVATLNNTGAISVATGATLNLTGQPGGVTDVVAGSSFSIAGSFTAGANNALHEFNQH